MYCGIDVAKNKSNICIMDSQNNIISEFDIVHDKSGFNKLIGKLTHDTKIGMEVTGNYSKALYNFLKDIYDVCFLDSNQIKNFAKFHSPLVKNDVIDARIIAKALVYGLKEIKPIKVDELKDLCKLYQKSINQLIKYKCMFKDQLNIIFPEAERLLTSKFNKGICNLLLRYSSPSDINTASLEAIRDAMNSGLKIKTFGIKKAQEIKELASESVGIRDYPTNCFKQTIKIMFFYHNMIEELIIEMEKAVMKTPYSRLMDRYGYNLIGLSVLVSEIGDIRRFATHKKIVSYCGYSITESRSGVSVNKKGHLSKRGNANIRHVLYVQVMSHLRRKTDLNDFYQRLKSKGKHANQCMTAVARKLAVRTYYDMMKCHQ